MTRVRLVCAAIIVPAIFALVWLDFTLGQADWLGRPGVVLFVTTLFVGLMAASEVLHFEPVTSPRRIKPWAVYLATAIVIILAFAPVAYEHYPADCPVGRTGWLAFGMAATIGIAFFSVMAGYRRGDRVMNDVARTVLIVAYIGLLIGFWAAIRGHGDNAWGMTALLSLFVPVKLSDSLAYITGRLWGRNKLSPELSPGKTIEGLAGGVAGGVFGAFLVLYVVARWLTGESSPASWWWVVIFGVCVTLAGVAGDLAESLMKREGDVKNSSRWLPGLGGITDMIDSLLAAGPVVLAFWITGIFGPVPL